VESIVITWRELLLVVALILAVYIAEMLLLLRTGGGLFRRHRPVDRLDAREAAEMRQDIAQLAERLSVLEGQIGQMTAENQPESTPYNRAIQMARQGRDAGRISESCGVSRGEAELIVSIHGRHE
jgi:hypothetical protein